MPAHKLQIILPRRFFRGFVVWSVVINLLVSGLPLQLVLQGGLVGEAEAASKTFSSSVDWKVGEYEKTESDSSFDNIRLKADGTWEPRILEAPEWTPGNPGVEVSDGTYIFMLRGSGDNEFYKYLPVNDEWRALPRPPFSVNTGDMVVLDGDIYVLAGNSQDIFYKFNIATETWTKLTNFPELVGSAMMTTDGNSTIYATRSWLKSERMSMRLGIKHLQWLTLLLK